MGDGFLDDVTANEEEEAEDVGGIAPLIAQLFTCAACVVAVHNIWDINRMIIISLG